MDMNKANARKRLLFTAIKVSMLTTIVLLALFVYKTTMYVEYQAATIAKSGCASNEADKDIEYLIVDLASYKVDFVVATAMQYGKKINEYTSKTQNIVLRRTPIGYWCVYEITQKQFEIVMGCNPSYFKGKYYMTRPVENVSRNKANVFVSRIRNRTGLPFRLPDKAEWTSACLAGDEDISRERMCMFGRISTNTPRSEELKAANAWKYYCTFGILEKWLRSMTPLYAGTQFVGSYLPNKWGLYDMHGNVSEWTSSAGGREDMGILMGGGCTSLPEDCTATSESLDGIDDLYMHMLSGFRVLLPDKPLQENNVQIYE